MGQRILLLGHERVTGLALAAMAVHLDVEPLAMGWEVFSVRHLGRRNRPDLVVVDIDRMPDIPVEALCQSLRRQLGPGLPIIGVTASKRFQDAARLIDAGISDCLPARPDAEQFRRKVTRWLAGDAPVLPEQLESGDPVPLELAAAFAPGGDWGTLGDLAAIHTGASVRNSFWRRMAPPDAGWRGVLTAADMDRFMVGKPGWYMRWSRAHLFRLPLPAEYAVREKVLLRRAGPPLAAAVDRSQSPVGTDVYSLIPNEGVPAGFVACLLNSRLADFYFNRLARVEGGRLRTDQVRRMPVPRPEPELMAELSRTASLLAHFGPNPRDWLDRQRKEELADAMDDLIFSLYGLNTTAREELAALHF